MINRLSKTRFQSVLRMSILTLAIMAAFMAGAFSDPFGMAGAKTSPQVTSGANNLVLEASSIATPNNPVIVYQEPSTESQPLVRLLWGDRVLWMGEEVVDAAGVRWVRVAIAEGLTGWTRWNITDPVPQLLAFSPVFTTPGTEIGVTIRITTEGNAANFRDAPGVQAPRIRKLQTGETLTVIGGPYQTQYFIWWNLRDANGTEGWLVDIQNWFEVVPQ